MVLHFSWLDLKIALKDIGSILEIASLGFVLPVIVSVLFGETLLNPLFFLAAGTGCLVLGKILKNLFQTSGETRLKHAFVSVGLVWAIFTVFAALPFFWIENISFSNAFFETMSALTTTGLTVLPNADVLARSIVFWRSWLSWIGGIGIIVMAVVGIFTTYARASKFIAAEGRSQKIKPNLKNAVKQIWKSYALLTLGGMVLLAVAGMSVFDALNYSMSAISTTGFGTSTVGVAGFDSRWIEAILMLIAMMGATSFMVHYQAITKKFNAYAGDVQFKAIVALSAVSAVLLFPSMQSVTTTLKSAVEYSLFHAIGATTNGAFALAKPWVLGGWDDFVKIVLVALMFIGGSAGSTSGGIKINRLLISLKAIYWKFKKTVSDSTTVFARKFDKRVIETSEVSEINQFILLYMLIAIAGTGILVFMGNPLENALFEVVSAQSNAGMSTGITHAAMPMASKLTLIALMWIGRLEILPLFAGIGLLLSIRKRKQQSNEWGGYAHHQTH